MTQRDKQSSQSPGNGSFLFALAKRTYDWWQRQPWVLRAFVRHAIFGDGFDDDGPDMDA
jgi:hypothetical protein